MTILYWNIGKRIKDKVLNNERAEYGKQVIKSLSENLVGLYGKGWGEKPLRLGIKFVNVFPDQKIVYALRRQLSWTHFRSLFHIDDPLKRDFQIEMCKIEKWSSRCLNERIQSLLNERTSIIKKPELTIKNELELGVHSFKKIFPFVDGIPTV